VNECGDVWRKSSYSADQGACVEINRRSQWVLAVRDSTNSSGPNLFFTHDEWKTFTYEVRRADFSRR
jgi:hypothetical protein